MGEISLIIESVIQKQNSMKQLIITAGVLFMSVAAFSQDRIFTRSGKISFYSKTPLEDIEAHNKAAISVLDKTTGQMEFSVLLKGFEFQKALMQEHFNEKYVESDKYPKATFKGKVNDISKVNFGKDGKYPVAVSGKLTLHGETKDVNANGTITVQGNAVSGNSEFVLTVADYKIVIPGLMADKIAKTVKVTVTCNYEPAK
jgi:hypothetical protein